MRKYAIPLACLAALITGAGVTIYLYQDDSLMTVFSNSVYYFLWCTVILFFISIYQYLRKKNVTARELFSQARLPAAVGLALAGIVFLAMHPEFRILSDETNLLSESLSMYREKALFNVIEADFYYNTLHPILKMTAHRPGFFAFLASLIHTVRGFHPENVFIVNYLIAAGVISVIFVFGRRIAGTGFGLSAAVITASFPLFCITASSGGFDALNLLMVLAVYYLIYRFTCTPSPELLDMLLFAYLLAAQCRYETAGLALPVLLAFSLHIRKIKEWRLSIHPPLALLLFLPVIWQKLISTHVANPGDPDDIAFKLLHIPGNILNALEFFFNPFMENYPVSEIVGLLAIIGGILLIVRLTRKSPVPGVRRAVILILIGHAVLFLAHCAYYFGDLRMPWTMRLGIIHVPLIAFGAAYALRKIAALFEYRYPAQPAVALFLVFLMFFGLSRAARNERAGSLTLYREFKRNREFLADYPAAGSLIISLRPNLYTALERGSLSFDHVRRNLPLVRKKIADHLYSTILVIQEIEYATGKSLTGQEFDGIARLETLREYESSDKLFIRISKVIAFR